MPLTISLSPPRNQSPISSFSSRVKVPFTHLADNQDISTLLQALSPLNNESEMDALIQSFSLSIEDHDDDIVTLVRSSSSLNITDHPTLIPTNTASETFPSMRDAAELEDTNSRNDSEDIDYDSEEINQKPIVTIFILNMLQKIIQSIFPDNIELGPEYEMNGIDSLGYKFSIIPFISTNTFKILLLNKQKDGMWFSLCFMNRDMITATKLSRKHLRTLMTKTTKVNS